MTDQEYLDICERWHNVRLADDFFRDYGMYFFPPLVARGNVLHDSSIADGFRVAIVDLEDKSQDEPSLDTPDEAIAQYIAWSSHYYNDVSLLIEEVERLKRELAEALKPRPLLTPEERDSLAREDEIWHSRYGQWREHQ